MCADRPMAASGDPVPVRASPVPASYDRTQAALEDMRRGRKGGASACARYWDLDEQQFRRAWKRERDGGVWTGSGRLRTLRDEDKAVLVQWVKWHAAAWSPRDALTVRSRHGDGFGTKATGGGRWYRCSGFAASVWRPMRSSRPEVVACISLAPQPDHSHCKAAHKPPANA